MTDAERKTTSLTQAAAQGYPGGMTAVVRIITKDDAVAGRKARAASTLYGDFSPHESSNGRLKVGDMIRVMQITGDHEPLRFLAALFGYTISPLNPHEPDAPTLEAEALQDYPDVVALHRALCAYRDGQTTMEACLALLETATSNLRQTFSRAIKGDEVRQ